MRKYIERYKDHLEFIKHFDIGKFDDDTLVDMLVNLIKMKNDSIEKLILENSRKTQEIKDAYDQGRQDGYACMPSKI